MSKSIAVIGGGIIGTCTAYYLSKHPKIGSSTIRIFEGTSIAAGASGKAGGFLAADWHEQRTASLASLSFKLHDKLAQEYDGEQTWCYRKVTTVEVTVDAKGQRNKSVPDAEWLSSVTKSSKIGSPTTTAQVTPGDFTRRIAKAAEESGVQIDIATVTELHENAEDGTWEVVAMTGEGEKISFHATDVVFAAGPWTGRLAKTLLGSKAGVAADIVESNCSNSIILRPERTLSSHVLFTSLTLPDGTTDSPEVYPRADGTVYLCGGGSSTTDPLPPKASDVHSSPHLVEKLRKYATFVAPDWLGPEKAPLEVSQACYRPDSSKTGAPIIGSFGKGLWIASGHQVWGISNGPGTGKVLSELILDGKATSANISALQPK